MLGVRTQHEINCFPGATERGRNAAGVTSTHRRHSRNTCVGTAALVTKNASLNRLKKRLAFGFRSCPRSLTKENIDGSTLAQGVSKEQATC